MNKETTSHLNVSCDSYSCALPCFTTIHSRSPVHFLLFVSSWEKCTSLCLSVIGRGGVGAKCTCGVRVSVRIGEGCARTGLRGPSECRSASVLFRLITFSCNQMEDSLPPPCRHSSHLDSTPSGGTREGLCQNQGGDPSTSMSPNLSLPFVSNLCSTQSSDSLSSLKG